MNEYQYYQALCNQDNLLINQLTPELINAHVDALQKKGLSIRQTDEGYSADQNIQFLDKNIILSLLTTFSEQDKKDIHFVYSCDSSNKKINDYSQNNKPISLITEYQSQGKGRRGKQWLSPIGNNLYFSIKFPNVLLTKISL